MRLTEVNRLTRIRNNKNQNKTPKNSPIVDQGFTELQLEEITFLTMEELVARTRSWLPEKKHFVESFLSKALDDQP